MPRLHFIIEAIHSQYSKDTFLKVTYLLQADENRKEAGRRAELAILRRFPTNQPSQAKQSKASKASKASTVVKLRPSKRNEAVLAHWLNGWMDGWMDRWMDLLLWGPG